MIRLAQSETYYPCKQEADSGVTAIAVGICRLTDGYWFDWNDSTFKNVGWTTQYQTLTEDTNGLWVYTTGWAIPNSNNVYMLQWKVTDAGGDYYAEGYQIVINDAVPINNIFNEEVDNDGVAISLKGALKLILATLTGKSSGGGTATVVFRDIADAKNRISATVDANGNRTAVGTRDAT